MKIEKQILFVANWKMYFAFDDDIRFVAEHYDKFIQLTDKINYEIVVCPSFLAIPTLSQLFKATKIKLGAQDCSEHNKGAFTGQVSAESLHDAGCSYCIVGHSERRMYNFETDEAIAQKVNHLIEYNISPIICIGENAEEYKSGKAFFVLEEQLEKIFPTISSQCNKINSLPICIAYEPIWSIGTGIIPSEVHLKNVFTWLATKTQKIAPTVNWKLLYGGSVKVETMPFLVKNLSDIHGFLIGGSSLDFQEFEKIVHYVLKA